SKRAEGVPNAHTYGVKGRDAAREIHRERSCKYRWPHSTAEHQECCNCNTSRRPDWRDISAGERRSQPDATDEKVGKEYSQIDRRRTHPTQVRGAFLVDTKYGRT